MFNELRNTAKQTSIYSIGNLLPKLVGFLLLPLYTDKLSTAEYGILAIIQATILIIVGIFGFNLHTAMLRWLAQEKEERTRLSIVFTTFVSTVSVVAVLLLLLLPFSAQFSLLFFNHHEFANYFTLLFITSGFGILNNIPLNLIRFLEKPKFYIVLTTIRFSLILLLNIYFVAIAEMGVEGIVLSELIGGAILLILSSKFLMNNLSPKFNLPILKQMFNYGFPLIFSTTFSLALTLGDRYIIKFLLDESSVGVYSLGHRIASVINVFLIQSFQLGYLPIAFKKLDNSNAKRFYSKVLTYFTLLLVLAALFFSLFGEEIIFLMSSNKEYYLAYTVIPIISLAFVFKGMQYVFSLAFHFTKQTSYNAYIVITISIINVAFNFLLIPNYGFLGAAYSMLISMIIMMILSFHFAQKLYEINYELKRLFILLIMGIAVYLVSLTFSFNSLYLKLTFKALLLVSLPPLLLIIRFFDSSELSRLKSFIKK